MEEQIEARVQPQAVWEVWEKSHALHGGRGIQEGELSKSKFRYKILDVVPGTSFSILWKSLFVRLIFYHKVAPLKNGSLVSYKVVIKGPFAWPIRWLIGEKIRKNLKAVLNSIVKDLENKRVV